MKPGIPPPTSQLPPPMVYAFVVRGLWSQPKTACGEATQTWGMEFPGGRGDLAMGNGNPGFIEAVESGQGSPTPPTPHTDCVREAWSQPQTTWGEAAGAAGRRPGGDPAAIPPGGGGRPPARLRHRPRHLCARSPPPLGGPHARRPGA